MHKSGIFAKLEKKKRSLCENNNSPKNQLCEILPVTSGKLSSLIFGFCHHGTSRDGAIAHNGLRLCAGGVLKTVCSSFVQS